MLLNLAGRVANVPLARTKSLLPLFEAVINSIQSIHSSPRKAKGRIEIEVLRDDREGSFEATKPAPEDHEVAGFVVTDNGVGFDDANFSSFETSDTRAKAVFGGRGIGRLLWLKAFRNVEIDSVYAEGAPAEQHLFRRRFRFLLSEKGVEEPRVVEAPPGTLIQTRVSLLGLKDEYAKTCPKRLQTIAERIIEHCLAYFLLPNCPSITLVEGSTTLDLHDVWEELFSETLTDTLEIQGQTFRLVQLRLYGSEHNAHKLHFCANDREVQSSKLSKIIPSLPTPLYGDDKRQFVWAAYVFGDYLDQHVHPERGGFTIPSDDADDLLPNEPSLTAITKGLQPALQKGLAPFLEPIEREKSERYKQYVEEQAPEYRAVLKHTDVVRELPPYLTEDQLEVELHVRKRDLEHQVRRKAAELVKDDGTLPSDFVQKLIDLNQANLTKYVLSRREVLLLLSRSLGQKPDGKYHLGLDPVSWTPTERRIRCPTWPKRSPSGSGVASRQSSRPRWSSGCSRAASPPARWPATST